MNEPGGEAGRDRPAGWLFDIHSSINRHENAGIVNASNLPGNYVRVNVTALITIRIIRVTECAAGNNAAFTLTPQNSFGRVSESVLPVGAVITIAPACRRARIKEMNPFPRQTTKSLGDSRPFSRIRTRGTRARSVERATVTQPNRSRRILSCQLSFFLLIFSKAITSTRARRMRMNKRAPIGRAG